MDSPKLDELSQFLGQEKTKKKSLRIKIRKAKTKKHFPERLVITEFDSIDYAGTGQTPETNTTPPDIPPTTKIIDKEFTIHALHQHNTHTTLYLETTEKLTEQTGTPD